MRISDKIDPHTLERREAHLSLLAIIVIAVMSIGMATAMYPLVFSHPATPETEIPRKAFYGFCVLSALMVIYLSNRHVVIRKLRKRIADGQKRIESIRRQASADLLRTLPGISRFQDRLTMEFRRCAHTGDRLSLLLILATVQKEFSSEAEIDNVFGDVAKALLVKLRQDDAMYGFVPGGFGVVISAPGSAAVSLVTDRLIGGLTEARAANGRFSFESRIINYPEQATTAWEMEQAMRSFLHLDQPQKAAATA